MGRNKKKLKKSLEEREEPGEEVSNSYSCKQCNKIFQHFCQFMKHYHDHIDSEKHREAPTSNSANKTTDKQGWRKHNLQTITPKKTLYLCSYCPKKLTTPFGLRIHTRIHTGERPYVCSYCGKSFRVYQYLNNHVRRHTGQKPYKCKICDKAFTSQIAAWHHRARKHTKPHPCVFCNESFEHNNYLVKHMTKKHTGEKDVFECKNCGKYFEDVKKLRVHHKTHQRGRSMKKKSVLIRTTKEKVGQGMKYFIVDKE